MTKIKAWASKGPKEKLVRYEYNCVELKPDEVEIAVMHCGLCHSDLSLLNNDWGMSKYPLIAGHEVIGKIVGLGKHVKGLKKGQIVGVGWNSESCMFCKNCISGSQHLCPDVHPTIVNHHGGFAERIRAEWQWVFPLPKEIDPRSAGPLFCAGATVFAPFMIHNIQPTSRIGIVGIGGLGHLAIQFAKAWGCEVTVFTHDKSKFAEAKKLGAHNALSSVDAKAIASMKGKIDMLLIAVNVPLDWEALLATLAPQGILHVLGLVEKPIPVQAVTLISKQLSISGSPSGSPSHILNMLEFAARHKITPQVEHFPMSKVNDALAYLKAGKPRYRVVLDADF